MNNQSLKSRCIRALKNWAKKIPLMRHIYRIYHYIFKEPLNRGMKFKLLTRYLKWYFYEKPKKRCVEVVLQNGMKSIVYPDSDSGEIHIFTNNADAYDNELIRKVLKKGDFIIDVGCNVGNRTLAVADIIGGAMLVDANEKCFPRLRRNFELNNICMDNYHMITKAVGSEKKTVAFTDFGETSCQNKVLASESRDGLKLKYVEMTTIDEEMKKLGNPPCAYIKFDLEGHDWEGLIGAKQTMTTKGMKLVKFEKWAHRDIRPFLELFQDFGWRVVALGHHGKIMTHERDISLARNLFAMPKDMLGRVAT